MTVTVTARKFLTFVLTLTLTSYFVSSVEAYVPIQSQIRPQCRQHLHDHHQYQRKEGGQELHSIDTCKYTAPPFGITIRSNRSNGITPSRLSAVPDNRDGDKDAVTTPVPLNTSLLRQLIFNQLLLGYSIWTMGIGYTALTRDTDLSSPETFLPLAVIGVLPLLFLSYQVETSESPLFSTLNLSTDVQTLRIFGPKPRPFVAFAVSALLAGLTGLVEEVTFRGQILPSLAVWSVQSGNLPFLVPPEQGVFYGTVLTTILFAALHVNPTGLLRGKDAALDCLVLFGFQLCTGSVFAALYLATGNLAVPILSHAVYDFYTFYKTHLVVTTQMAYADDLLLAGDGTVSKVEQQWVKMRGEEFVREARRTFYLMDTNRDGVVSREELRIGLCSFGIRISRTESQVVLEEADVDGSGEIDFDEFLGFMGMEGSTSKAIKGSLLGVM